jgi:hypothetical protein
MNGGEEVTYIGFWWEKSEGKRPLGSWICRGVYNFKLDLREIGWAGVDWIDLAQDRDKWSKVL